MTVAAVDPASATDADVAATHAVHIAAMTVDRPDDPQPPLADFALRLTNSATTNDGTGSWPGPVTS